METTNSTPTPRLIHRAQPAVSLSGIMALDAFRRAKIKRFHMVAWLTCLSLLLSLSGGIMVGDRAKAQSLGNPAKASSDLLKKAHSLTNTDIVKVIVQLRAPMSSSLNSLLNSNGVHIRKSMQSLGAHAVDMPASIVDTVAAFDEVSFVSLDRATQSMGHLSATTGADAVRTTSGINVSGVDGSGIGVAVLDSGIYTSQVGFLDKNSNIRVVNMSLGTPAVDSYRNDPICRAVRSLVNAGVVVVVAAGNNGKDSSDQKVYGMIHCPGNEPSAITVGAANTFGTDARNDDGVATYSSRGPTRSYWTDTTGLKHYDSLIKPDLVAPGNKIIDAEAHGNLLVTQNPQLDASVSIYANRKQMYLSGTSMAAPVVAGAAVLLLQANPNLTPNMVKALLMYTAQPLNGFNMFEQGAGEINIEGAVRLARLVRTDLGTSKPVGSTLLTTLTPPTPQTTIAGYSFTWAQGIVLG